ncbi:forkhead box protein I2-B [Chelonus insularis]|uniref:forkhead box protein I2-B n=1 Tax=Chelonus insularis TaxID=460826 RepID=UPI001589DE2D|nr:forkhead box protein I2-B [Chelonus insularis]
MCSNDSPPPTKESLTVDLNIGSPMAGFLPGLEHYRLQLYHYAMAERLRLAQQLHPQHPGLNHSNSGSSGSHLTISSNFPAPLPLYPTAAAVAAATSYPNRLALSMALLHPHHQRIPEEPKPQHSYIGLIAMAILSSPEKKLVLSDIYQHILEHYPYFRSRGPGWRNSIRHNLSLNDCFVKSGRSANGKGHYWAIHPANMEDFRRGDFRRRKAQRKVRRHMGLAVDEEPDSPSPPPLPSTPPLSNSVVSQSNTSSSLNGIWCSHSHQNPYLPQIQSSSDHNKMLQQIPQNQLNSNPHNHFQRNPVLQTTYQPSRKRQFDVASLLAPDDQQMHIKDKRLAKSRKFSSSEDEHENDNVDNDEDVDVDIETHSYPSPHAHRESPDVKISYSSNGCNWNKSASIKTMQPLLTTHLHSHLYMKSHYVQTNNTSSSSI